MLKIGKIEIDKALLLAPMEDITDLTYRRLCKELGADIVYTEFVNCEGLVRADEKTHKKLRLSKDERPAGIQIYGDNIESMVRAAKIAEEENPDIIDINAGCWVKKVAGRGSGAALMKDPEYLQQMVGDIVKAVDVPVTVKTRLGWDFNSINIVEIAQRIEDVGAQAITIHCRTKSQGHSGDADWSYIEKVKNKINIPVVLNGGIMTFDDAKRAFEETPADGIMIARGAIQYPWIFKEIKEYLENGKITSEISFSEKISLAVRHLKLSVELKGERRAVIEFRKFYSGYLKGLYKASSVRSDMMKYYTFEEVEKRLLEYQVFLEEYYSSKPV